MKLTGQPDCIMPGAAVPGPGFGLEMAPQMRNLFGGHLERGLRGDRRLDCLPCLEYGASLLRRGDGDEGSSIRQKSNCSPFGENAECASDPRSTCSKNFAQN